MTPSGTRGPLNDAVSIYFSDAALASAFVARWCVGARADTGRRRSTSIVCRRRGAQWNSFEVG